jgi:amino-acid N-acetyltransferase
MEGKMLRKARVGEVKTIHRMINISSRKEEMLPRSLMDIYANLRDFFVYLHEDGTTIEGICAMRIIWENLAEIRSLYVDEKYRHRGIGRKLIEACISEAMVLQLLRIFALTREPEFFRRLGFIEVDRHTLSEKIWSDCFHCSKYPDFCDEEAMVIDL